MSVLTDAIDAEMDALILQLLPLQEERADQYHFAPVVYWQGAPTHAVIPADGVKIPPNPDAAVAGEPSWAEFGVILPAETLAAYEVWTYITAEGSGWLLRAQVVENGERWSRAANVGPAERLGHGWEKAQIA